MRRAYLQLFRIVEVAGTGGDVTRVLDRFLAGTARRHGHHDADAWETENSMDTQLLRRAFSMDEFHRMAEAGVFGEDDRVSRSRGAPAARRRCPGVAWRGTRLVRFLDRQAHGDGGWVARFARHAETIVESLRIIGLWQGLVLMQAGYLGIWLALAGVNYAVLRALEIGAPVAAAFIVLIVLQVGTSVPSTPGKIGVFQYLTVLALAPFGVAREPALTYGVLLHVVGFVPLVAPGGFWSWTGLAAKRRVP